MVMAFLKKYTTIGSSLQRVKALKKSHAHFRRSMLKLTTHSGFHDLFLNYFWFYSYYVPTTFWNCSTSIHYFSLYIKLIILLSSWNWSSNTFFFLSFFFFFFECFFGTNLKHCFRLSNQSITCWYHKNH
jgi:hypothetical protein